MVLQTTAMTTSAKVAIWCPRRDSNSQNLVSKTSTYTNSVTRAINNRIVLSTKTKLQFGSLLNCRTYPKTWREMLESNQLVLFYAVDILHRMLFVEHLAHISRILVPNSGNDPLTFALSRRCSTSELIGYYLKNQRQSLIL